MNEQNSPNYTRKHERSEVLVEARIMDGAGWHDCLIVNISVSGAKLQIDFQFRQSEIVRLQIGNFGEFGGAVTWQNFEEVGIKFNHDPSELADVVMGLAMYG